MNKIQLIEQAIENADKLKSNLIASNFDVPALVSLRGRHLYNNLGALSTRVLEIGSHLGGSLTSTMGQNNLISVTAIDNFASDWVEDRQCMPLFLENVKKHLPSNTKFNFIHSDAFEASLEEIPNGIDMYIYDGSHDMESQRKAVAHYLDKMADEFIFIVDDADWVEVKEGTKLGVKTANVDVLYFKHLQSNGSHDNDSWWNGYFVYLLKKK
jgi:hypothetical protein